MKKLLPLLLATSLLLSACSIDWNNKDDLFQKNQQCLSKRSEIINRINSDNKKYENQEYTFVQELLEIFYSPKEENCLFTTTVKTNDKDNGSCTFNNIYNLAVFDKEIKTSVEMTEINWKIQCDYLKSLNRYEKLLKELKWE